MGFTSAAQQCPEYGPSLFGPANQRVELSQSRLEIGPVRFRSKRWPQRGGMRRLANSIYSLGEPVTGGEGLGSEVDEDWVTGTFSRCVRS